MFVYQLLLLIAIKSIYYFFQEGHLFGFPPMSDVDSKMLMLQSLAPNAMKAYKRKKLMLFPANNSGAADGQMEMELDSGDGM